MFDRHLSKRISRAVALSCGIAAMCAMSSPTASAQNWNKETKVTFSQPVEIPGISAQVLPAGTYVFRLLDSLSDRNIVQIFSEDKSHLYANILAIPNHRLVVTDKTVMTFAERAAGSPQAIRAWFYPGDNSGQEFVYPKAKAVELAKITNVPVLYIPDTVAPNIVAPVTVATEAPVIALERAPIRAVRPTGQDIAIAEVVTPPPVQAETVRPPVVQVAENLAPTLPRTASDLPLLALMGFLCLGLGITLRALCVR
jgi:hypothetical protein